MRQSPHKEAKRKKMNEMGIVGGGYNVPPLVWMEERRKEFERAFEFARKEKEGER